MFKHLKIDIYIMAAFICQNILKISMLAGKVAVSCTHNPL